MLEPFICILFFLAVSLAGCATLMIADRARVLDGLDWLALSFPSGLGALGAVFYTLNILGIPFSRPLILTVLAGSAAAGLWALWRRRERWRGTLRSLRSRSYSFGIVGVVALAVAILIAAGYMARAYYRVNYQFDTEMYHFPYANIVFRTHHQPTYATVSSGEEFSFPPALFEVYAALWVCLGHVNQLLPNLIPIPLFLCWALLTALAVRRCLGGSDAAVAFSLLLFTATYEDASMLCGEGTDFLPALLAGGAAYLAALDYRSKTWNRLPAAVMLLGINNWIKYHGVPFSLCLALAVMIARRFFAGRSVRSSALYGLWLFLGGMALFGPLLIRNFIVWHNPIYPAGCRWFGGYLATPWAINVVAALWQPPRPFWEFPSVLCRTLREPAVILGIPALIGAWRSRRGEAVVLGLPAFLSLIIFLALLSNRTPLPLRFVLPALGLLSWLGGVQIDRLAEGSLSSLRMLAVWGIFCGVLIACYLHWMAPHIHPLDRGSWLDPPNAAQAFFALWWPIPFVLLIFASMNRRARTGVPHLPALAAVLFLSGLAMVIHGPFNDLMSDWRLGVLRKPDWSRPPQRTALFSWMAAHLGPRAVTYTFYRRRWSTPGALVPADDPMFESIHHPGTSVPDALEALRRAGIQYVLFSNDNNQIVEYPAFQTDPIYKHLDDARYFQPLDRFMGAAIYKVIYNGATPEKPGPGHPMPWLMKFAASGVH